MSVKTQIGTPDRGGRFTFVLTERDVSLLLDALDAAVINPPSGSTFSRENFAQMMEYVEWRLSW